jgi:hypothetical protein
VRLDHRVVALLLSTHLERDVGEHLVRVHVRGRAGATLEPVDLKLIVVLAIDDGLGGLLDRRQLLSVQRTDVGVGAGGRELDDRPGFHEPRVVIDRDAGNLKVLQRTRRLHAVIRVGGNLFLAEQIVFGSRLRSRCADLRTRCGRGRRFVTNTLYGGRHGIGVGL